MSSYIIRRVLASLLVIFLVSVFVFSIIHLLPGDPIKLALGDEATEEDVQRIREERHLNDPLPKQYWIWVTGLFKGDFGYSLLQNRPVSTMLAERLPRTISLGLPAFLISVTIGILFGIISAVKRGSFIDQLITLMSTLGLGTPQFWIGMLLIYVFGMVLNIFPIRGLVLPSEDFGGYIRSMILPVFCMSLHMIASVSRQTRSNMLEVVKQDYIRTARANGLSEKKIIFGHALKNALIPVVTYIGMQTRGIIGGSVMIESLFSIAGIGGLMREAIDTREYWVLQSCVLLLSFVAVFSNLIVDIVYGYIDPRIRESRR
ncbi:MAG: ABC transporter permease [Lachnospiraceae bacterium]|nr:ABC transporter permease [Lachnospiraceae bacterium]